jgi:hypothetical protein
MRIPLPNPLSPIKSLWSGLLYSFRKTDAVFRVSSDRELVIGINSIVDADLTANMPANLARVTPLRYEFS